MMDGQEKIVLNVGKDGIGENGINTKKKKKR
jgi:hypothetical protein